MFNFLKKDPKAKLEKAYAAKIEEATNAQRSGDLRLYAKLIEESDEIVKQIEALSK